MAGSKERADRAAPEQEGEGAGGVQEAAAVAPAAAVALNNDGALGLSAGCAQFSFFACRLNALSCCEYPP
eukprot:1084931-Pelagomonas_calceolata.AAC.1